LHRNVTFLHSCEEQAKALKKAIEKYSIELCSEYHLTVHAGIFILAEEVYKDKLNVDKQETDRNEEAAYNEYLFVEVDSA